MEVPQCSASIIRSLANVSLLTVTFEMIFILVSVTVLCDSAATKQQHEALSCKRMSSSISLYDRDSRRGAQSDFS